MSKPDRITIALTPKQQGVVWPLYGAADIEDGVPRVSFDRPDLFGGEEP